MNNKITEAYLSEALKNCPFGFRKRLKSDLYSSLCDFAEEKPSFNESELLFRFGAPQQYAAEYIASLEDKERVSLLSKTKFIKRAVAVVVATTLLILTVGTAIIVMDSLRSSSHYYEVTVDENN